MIRSRWDQRIRRAGELAAELPFSAEVLRFYCHITEFQNDLFAGMPGTPTTLDALLPKFPNFLAHVMKAAPEPMRRCVRELRECPPGRWLDLLHSFWSGMARFQPEPGHEAELLASLFLQPYAEYLADHQGGSLASEEAGRCPFCFGLPVAGVLRQEGDGGKRSLVCGLCATEWDIGRMLCPACGEQNPERLPIYTAEQFPYMRVEACEACHTYIKTVDLTRNGRAVPVVDELATLPLNLWAEQHAFAKLRRNLLGM
ncbi:MAG TPA: formate dehydrogenase accessory protein FdhE [Bryobacteraceae bacterium]|nr:formate dehydrogenase accessory protein FdhE [Bryobacteraceae bacterium]